MALSDFTHFRFPTLPQRSILKVDAVIAVAGVWYAAASIVKTEKINVADYAEPFDSFTYQTTNGTLTSEIQTVTVNMPPDKTGIPIGTTKTEVILNSAVVDIGSLINVNNSTDRIKIISYSENGNFSVNGGSIFPNLEVMQYDLANLIFIAPDEVFGNFQLSYKVGNIDGYEDIIYVLTFEIDGQSSLVLISNLQSVDGLYQVLTSQVDIIDGFPELAANFDILFDFTGTAFDPGNLNNILIEYAGNTVSTNQTTTQNLSAIIFDNGTFSINLTVKVLTSDIPLTGTIDITLNNIDGDPLKVSINNFISLPINFSV